MAFTVTISPDKRYFIAREGANADADADFTVENLPSEFQGDEYLTIEGIALTLATDANAANRRVLVRVMDGATEMIRWAAAAVQAASLTERYVFGGAGAGLAAVVDLTHLDPLPLLPLMSDTSILRVSLINGQAGDVVNPIVVWGRIQSGLESRYRGA